MRITGTKSEIDWLVDAISQGSDCTNCPVASLCDTIHAIEERNEVKITNCEDVIRRHLVTTDSKDQIQ